MKPIAKTVIVNVETVARFKVQSRHKYFYPNKSSAAENAATQKVKNCLEWL